MNRTIAIIIASIVFVGGIFYLSQAVEPSRTTIVKVIDNARFDE